MTDRLKTLVEHAARVWSAEEENARRLNAKRNYVLTQVGVIIGVLVIRAGRFELVSLVPSSFLGMSRALLATLIALMLILAAKALLASATPRVRKKMHASEYMSMHPNELETRRCPDQEAALQSTLYKLTDAGLRLSTLNCNAAYNISRGQLYLSNAYLLALVLLLALGISPLA